MNVDSSDWDIVKHSDGVLLFFRPMCPRCHKVFFTVKEAVGCHIQDHAGPKCARASDTTLKNTECPTTPTKQVMRKRKKLIPIKMNGNSDTKIDDSKELCTDDEGCPYELPTLDEESMDDLCISREQDTIPVKFIEEKIQELLKHLENITNGTEKCPRHSTFLKHGCPARAKVGYGVGVCSIKGLVQLDSTVKGHFVYKVKLNKVCISHPRCTSSGTVSPV